MCEYTCLKVRFGHIFAHAGSSAKPSFPPVAFPIALETPDNIYKVLIDLNEAGWQDTEELDGERLRTGNANAVMDFKLIKCEFCRRTVKCNNALLVRCVSCVFSVFNTLA